jgi:hypothetical protein
LGITAIYDSFFFRVVDFRAVVFVVFAVDFREVAGFRAVVFLVLAVVFFVEAGFRVAVFRVVVFRGVVVFLGASEVSASSARALRFEGFAAAPLVGATGAGNPSHAGRIPIVQSTGFCA